MKELKKLIKELCPDGVEYKQLGDICEIKRGNRITKKDLIENGQYNVVSGGEGFMGKYDKYNRPENTITIAQYGSAGYINFITEKFWANDVCYCVFPNEIVDNKFLYYAIKNQQELVYSLRTDAIPSCLPLEKLKTITIPVPPIQIQKEIVNVLDKFSELAAELAAELAMRNKQKEHFMKNLFSFTELTKESEDTNE